MRKTDIKPKIKKNKMLKKSKHSSSSYQLGKRHQSAIIRTQKVKVRKTQKKKYTKKSFLEAILTRILLLILLK